MYVNCFYEHPTVKLFTKCQIEYSELDMSVRSWGVRARLLVRAPACTGREMLHQSWSRSAASLSLPSAARPIPNNHSWVRSVLSVPFPRPARTVCAFFDSQVRCNFSKTLFYWNILRYVFFIGGYLCSFQCFPRSIQLYFTHGWNFTRIDLACKNLL